MNQNQFVLEMLIALRGGLPEKCDFCGKPYCETRWPIPEEAGEWACNECLEAWSKEPPQCPTCA